MGEFDIKLWARNGKPENAHEKLVDAIRQKREKREEDPNVYT
jgi:hypothetical protein